MPELIAPPEPHLFYAYGTLLMTKKHRFVRTLQETFEPSIHGHRPWDSSYLLMDYLNLGDLSEPAAEQPPLLQPGDAVLELGCGWGAVSVHCARRFKAQATALDRDPAVFPFLQVQAVLNDVTVTTHEADFEDVKRDFLSGYQVVLGADICFWDSLVTPLDTLAQEASSAGVKHLLLADPGRPPFHHLAERLLQRYPGEHLNWYSLDPKRVEGELLHVQLQS